MNAMGQCVQDSQPEELADGIGDAAVEALALESSGGKERRME
jgi:hypothetical protein